MDKFMKMVEKKKKSGKEMSDVEKDAKMSVAQKIRDGASDKMGERLGKLKKVSVMSDSKEGLENGLEAAKEIMEGKEEDEEEDEEVAEESDEEMSEDEINSKIEKLMALKKKMGDSKEG